MMAQPFPAGMAQAHPGMGGPGHPMAGMQHHAGAHMGGPPAPGMMPGMGHPGVSGPQVTQGGPMVTGMPQGPGTPAPGGPMHNPMAMAHLGPQQQMFQQQNPQMNVNQMPMNPQQQQQVMMRQQMMARLHAQQQGMTGMMPGNPAFNQQMAAQMKMGNMPMQHQMMQAHPNAQAFQQQQQQHQQRMMQMQAQQQAAMAAQQNQQRQAQAQQMQMSRSQEQPTSQPPQPQPTPAPQNVSQPPSQPTPQPQPTAQAKPAPTPQPQNNPPPNQNNQPPVKQGEGEEEEKIKQQQMENPMMMQEIPREQPLNGQCVLQLILLQDSLASPLRPTELGYWEEIIRKYFSPIAMLKQVVFSASRGEKAYGLQFPSLARFYHAHFVSGIQQILLQSYDHIQNRRPTGETQVQSQRASLTYVFSNDIRVTTQGSLNVLFDVESKIIRLDILTQNWQEYIPRTILGDGSPQQENKQSPKVNKNLKKAQQQSQKGNTPAIPSSGVCEYGVPQHIIKFLEIAEVMTSMGPLMEYYHSHPGIGPRESLTRINQENQQNITNANNARLQNQMARAANGQVPFNNNMAPGMNGPNQFASPAMAHLGLPQGQGSPHVGGPVHTPSPAQNAAGGVAMMHQMSAQGSNLSGSQGPSTNTSPNVSNKKRRQSAANLKMEDGNGEDGGNANRVKPSPRLGGKRQKGAP